MRRSATLTVAVQAILLAACTIGGGGSPLRTPSQASQASETAATPTPSPSPGSKDLWLRAWVTQALPPVNVFSLNDRLVVTGDGIAVAPLPIADIHPQPAVAPLAARQLTQAVRDRILARARDLGLLSGRTDFGAPDMPGAATAHILLAQDGGRLEIAGDPTATIMCVRAPCDPEPGTPAAFGQFWRQLTESDWASDWPGEGTGPQQPYQPTAYSVLVGPAPVPDPQLGADIARWPLATPIAQFGTRVLDGGYRCGTVDGPDASRLSAALATANSLTQWTQSETTSATFGLVVRPLVAGQDACREIFGVG